MHWIAYCDCIESQYALQYDLNCILQTCWIAVHIESKYALYHSPWFNTVWHHWLHWLLNVLCVWSNANDMNLLGAFDNLIDANIRSALDRLMGMQMSPFCLITYLGKISWSCTILYYIPRYKLPPNFDQGTKIGMVMIWGWKRPSFKTGQNVACSFKTGVVPNWVLTYTNMNIDWIEILVRSLNWNSPFLYYNCPFSLEWIYICCCPCDHLWECDHMWI